MRCLRKGVATDSLLGVCVVVHHGLHVHHGDHEGVSEGDLGGQKSIFLRFGYRFGKDLSAPCIPDMQLAKQVSARALRSVLGSVRGQLPITLLAHHVVARHRQQLAPPVTISG